jgi:flagellar biosynthesis protein FlhF
MMQVKRFVAPSYAEALIKAKHELGVDALIVESKKVRVGGVLGLFGKVMTEVTVASDLAGAPSRSPAPAPAPNQANLEREIAALRAAVTKLAEREHGTGHRQVPLTGYHRKVFEELVARGVEEAAALDLGRRAGSDSTDGRRRLRQELDRLLGPSSPTDLVPGQRQVLALVGPTGVGKTTTIAKLAARFALEQGLSVGLITADTFRIAAVEQLRTYAEILGVPLHTVDTPAQVAEALRATAAHDLVLVDTGGRNHKDPARMAELRELLAVIRPDETHLVFSLSANPRDAFEALDYYMPLGVNRLTFTKLDEASSPGLMLNVRMRCPHPIGYITCGQSVPDDILSADRADFTKILLGA